MTCGECKLWAKRELKTRNKKSKRKEFYPTGRCMNRLFNDGQRMQFTSATTNCSYKGE